MPGPCTLCGLTVEAPDPNLIIVGDEDADGYICPWHILPFGDDWAESNRAMCNWLHRGIIPERLPRQERDDDFWSYIYAPFPAA